MTVNRGRTGNTSTIAAVMITRDLRALVVGLHWQSKLLVAFGSTLPTRVIMNDLLFALEVFVGAAGIALVPRQSELRICRTRVMPEERERDPGAAGE